MRYLAIATTQILGILLIALGIVGLFLPFLQGILLLVLGVYLCSFSFPRVRTRLYGYLAPYPRLVALGQRTDARIKRLFRLSD
jgi:uncharacterized membrane protein YbaN (DUF454 family)